MQIQPAPSVPKIEITQYQRSDGVILSKIRKRWIISRTSACTFFNPETQTWTFHAVTNFDAFVKDFGMEFDRAYKLFETLPKT